MISYFPEIYEDELVYSWFARYFAHSGYPCYVNALEDLFIKRNCAADIEFIGPINQEAKSIMESICTMDKLIFEHTMFPQYARFLDSDRQKIAIESLIVGRGDPHNLLSVPTSSSTRVVRYCPLCAQEDREKYGETYFHRSHLIRGIMTCTKHKCKLRNTKVEISKCRSPRLHVPEDVIPTTTFCDDDISASEAQQRFDEYLMQCFYLEFRFLQSESVGMFISSKLDGTRYLSSGGRKKHVALLYEDILKFFGDNVPQGIQELYHLQKILTGYNTNFLWVCQLAYFLDISPQDLCTPETWNDSIAKSRWSKPLPKARNYSTRTGKTKENWITIDKEMAPLVKKIAKDIYEGGGGRPRRVTQNIVEKIMKWPNKRIDCLPLCKKIILEYYESFEDYWARECVWAYNFLKTERGQKIIVWKDLRELINLRKENFQKCIPYLIKHTDHKTIQELEGLING